MVSKNISKLCHKFKNAKKNYPNSLDHDKINLDVRVLVILIFVSNFIFFDI